MVAHVPRVRAGEIAAHEIGHQVRAGRLSGEPVHRLRVVEELLNNPQPVNRLPAQPTGASLVADLMGSYFNSADAWDTCYRAEIQRDSCRTLDNSAEPPRPVK